MRLLLKTFIILLIPFLFIPAQSNDLNMVKNKISAIDMKYAKAVMDNDLNFQLSVFTEDGLYMPDMMPMVKGKMEIKKMLDMNKGSNMKMNKFELNSFEVMPAGDYYMEFGTYVMDMTIPDMKDPWHDTGKYFSLWEKQKNGDMLIKAQIWNSDINAWEVMQKMMKNPPPPPKKNPME